jgi:disulfide bond formation protein DsbB
MARHHTPKWILAGAAVDATHAATMALLAAVRPDRRKLALTNVASATMLAVSGVYEARHAARGQHPQHLAPPRGAFGSSRQRLNRTWLERTPAAGEPRWL